MNKQVKVERLHYIFIIACMLLYVITRIVANNPDSDSYFLMEIGKYIVENTEIPTTNVWTLHEDFDIIIQQWVCDVANYGAYYLAGYTGLTLWTIILTAIANILLWNYSSLYTNNNKIKLFISCVINILLLGYMNTRPQFGTFILVLYELTTLQKYETQKDNKAKFILKMCLISILQINWQASMWPMTLIMILPYVVPAVWNIKETDLHKLKTYAITALAMIITALLNPSGVDALTYLFKSYDSTSTNAFISEMLSPNIKTSFAFFIILTIVLFTIVLKDKYYDKALIYLTLGTVLLAIMHIRNNWLVAFSLVQLISKILNDKVDSNRPEASTSKPRAILIAVAYTITIAIMSILLIGAIVSTDDTIRSQEPKDAVEYLNKLDKDTITLFTEFNNGAYLGWHGYKVYIDARAETYTKNINNKKDIYNEYIDLRKGDLDFEDFLDEYNFTHLIATNNTTLDVYLRYNDDYTAVVDNDVYRLYEVNSYKGDK